MATLGLAGCSGSAFRTTATGTPLVIGSIEPAFIIRNSTEHDALGPGPMMALAKFSALPPVLAASRSARSTPCHRPPVR
jgi:hypothetical protein